MELKLHNFYTLLLHTNLYIGEICTSIFRDRTFRIQYNHNNDRTDKRLEYSGIYALNIDFGFSTK